jgi:hypothetical protein
MARDFRLLLYRTAMVAGEFTRSSIDLQWRPAIDTIWHDKLIGRRLTDLESWELKARMRGKTAGPDADRPFAAR